MRSVLLYSHIFSLSFMTAVTIIVNSVDPARDKMASKIYENFASRAHRINKALIRDQGIVGMVVQAFRSVGDFENDRRRKFLDSYIFKQGNSFHETNKLAKISEGTLELLQHIFSETSPSGSVNIVGKSTTTGNAINSYLEVTRFGLASYEIDTSDFHESFINDGWFGRFSWSDDEKYFVYVAKQKGEKKSTYFPSTVTPDLNAHAAKNNPSKQGDYFEYLSDWGEQYTGLASLVFGILDIEQRKVFIVNPPDPSVSEQYSTTGSSSSSSSKWTIGQPTFVRGNHFGVANSSPVPEGEEFAVARCVHRFPLLLDMYYDYI